MGWLIAGLVVGLIVGLGAGYWYALRQTAGLQYDLEYLRSRLRSLVRLVEAGLIKPESVEAANVLTEVRDLVGMAAAMPKSPPLARFETDEARGEEEDVRSLFSR